MSELGEFAMWMAYGLMGVGIFFGPIAKSVGRWIESKAGGAPKRLQRTPPGGVPAERMAELEERLDFAERLLSQRGEPERLR
jgi:hypothetical protein